MVLRISEETNKVLNKSPLPGLPLLKSHKMEEEPPESENSIQWHVPAYPFNG